MRQANYAGKQSCIMQNASQHVTNQLRHMSLGCGVHGESSSGYYAHRVRYKATAVQSFQSHNEWPSPLVLTTRPLSGAILMNSLQRCRRQPQTGSISVKGTQRDSRGGGRSYDIAVMRWVHANATWPEEQAESEGDILLGTCYSPELLRRASSRRSQLHRPCSRCSRWFRTW